MKITNSNKIPTNLISDNDIETKFIKEILGNKSKIGKRDLFIKNEEPVMETYTASSCSSISASIKDGYISESTLLELNNMDYKQISTSGNTVDCHGKQFTISQIPEIDVSTLKEIKSENNVIDFGENQYYKYVSKDGVEHKVFASDRNGIGFLYSDYLRGEPQDTTLDRYTEFWRYLMSDDPVYIDLSFTRDEVRAYMEEAGMKPGFVTIKMGGREVTQYYSPLGRGGIIESKKRYDILYESYTKGGTLLSSYEPGDFYKVNGKKYLIKDDYTIDLPYGEDMNIIAEPDNYAYGKKKV